MKKMIFFTFLMTSMLVISCSSNNEQIQPDPGPKYEKSEPVYEIPNDDELDTSVNANDARFNLNKIKMKENSILKGKKIYWLGSSVTYGSASEQLSMVDYVSARTGCISTKEAVSGTTLYNNGSNSYVMRMQSGKIFDTEEKIDAFVCQISTNDCTNDRLDKRGRMTADDVLDINEFDNTTTLGAVEYIITYVAETWNCPIYFYSGAYFSDGSNKAQRQNNNPKGSEYGKFVNQVKQIAEKWDSYMDYNVKVIDLYNDEEFNSKASSKYYSWATSDTIHPKKAGYSQWWSPYIQAFIENDFIDRL